MTFIKFHSITNHYQAVWMQKWLERYPELKDETYVVTEKLHGANVQVYFEPGRGNALRVGSRNRWLEDNSRFFNVWDALSRIGHILSQGKHWAWRSQKSLRLFGELHGGSVQNGVNYGPEQNIRFFAAMVDNKYISTAELLSLDIPGLLQNFVPVLALNATLEEALAIDIEIESRLTPIDHEGDNIIEGVVIQPYNHVYLDYDSVFVIKKKNTKFGETKKKNREPVESVIVELRVEFLCYITETRIDSIISQNGPFIEIQQLGEYIRLILQDAKEEFVFSHTGIEKTLDKKAHKYIFNVGGTIANMLKTRLANAAAA